MNPLPYLPALVAALAAAACGITAEDRAKGVDIASLIAP